ncbi:AraC family transcriptional regulator [Gordoniibacillus kamchatkensis]|uniref:AraC family transcriptional regulator n=1 Tax=Gordoniibacillus kamchatkensis TaxID=1590651 RepID=UPI0009E2EA24|nr:AraC family transcriptional regulator [Paenibacillus sp. VKM B-2647]
MPLTLTELTALQPIVPYIRESDYAVRKPWSMGERRLLDYLLIYVQEGLLRVTADGTLYELRDGDFCLLQPNTLHALEGVTPTITPFAHLDFFYNPLRADSFPTKAGQTDLSAYSHLLQPRLNDLQGIEVPVKFKPGEPTAFRDKLLGLVQCWQTQDEPLQQLRAQSLALELFIALLAAYAPQVKDRSAPPHTLNWVTSYVSFRLSEPISVAEMARRANLSPSRFNVVFRERFGASPHQYLLELRLKHAEELLRAGALPLAEVAAYCGFADIHHFAKSFKRRFGDAPAAYRKRAAQAEAAEREDSEAAQRESGDEQS